MGYTYLASPYSHPDPAVMEQRFETACRVAGWLMARGEIVFCPIAMSHSVAVRYDLPRDGEFWQRQAREMVSLSKRLVVVKMDGWQTSIGVTAEICIAESLGNYILDYRRAP